MRELTYRRSKRTRAANEIRGTIDHMLADPATWDERGNRIADPVNFRGLPSWWPFWSDALKDRVRDLVREARTLAELEGIEL